MKERRQRASESLTELGQDIWRLTNLAYPTAPSDVRETLAKEQFIDALISSDMRLRIKQARPTSLNMAVRHAVELEAFNKAEIADEEADVEEQEPARTPSVDQSEEEEEETRYTTRGRRVRKPEWYKDFVSSLFRCDHRLMVNTKTTPRKPMKESKVICPVCKKDIPEGQTFEQHVVGCAKTRVNQLSQCGICKVTFIKEEYRKRHMKREHGKEAAGRHSDWDSDPEVEVGDVEKDPCVRKRSLPRPVAAPSKVARQSVESGQSASENVVPRPMFRDTPLRRVAHIANEKKVDAVTSA